MTSHFLLGYRGYRVLGAATCNALVFCKMHKQIYPHRKKIPISSLSLCPINCIAKTIFTCSLFSDNRICHLSLVLSPYKPKKNTKISALSYWGVAENYCLWFNQLKDSLRGNATTKTLFPVANWVLNKQSSIAQF